MSARIRNLLGFGAAFAALLTQAAAVGQPYQALAGGPSVASDPARRSVVITKGRSASIDFPIDIRISGTTDPKVADLRMVTARRAVIMGTGYGQTDAQFLDANGRVVMTVDVRVEQDISALDQAIARVVPTGQVQTQSVNDNIILSGTVANAADADKAVQMAAIFAAAPDKVRNFLTIAGNDQVMLKVQVVEVNRTAIKQLGFNTNAVFGQLGMDQYLAGNTPSYAVNGGFQGGFSGGFQRDTTTQPVSMPLTNMFPGLTERVPLDGTGIDTGSIPQFVNGFLRGDALSGAQNNWVRRYLNGFIGTIEGVDPVTGASLTMQDVGITADNLQEMAKNYAAGTGTLTAGQRAWLSSFTTQLPAYNNVYMYDEKLTFVDRSNPADYVATDRAGSTGTNQAQALIQAFERQGLVRTLAEPNLTAVSGQAAKFLAGGEYPVPSGRDNMGNVAIEFKPYGVGLGFTPVVLSDGRISLTVSTEVSELTAEGALTLAGVAGQGTSLTIPALTVRRLENTVELPAGGSIMLAGLLKDDTRQNIDKVPGVADMPVFGALARSRDFRSNQSELVIIASVYLVHATARENLQTPADGLHIASDLETTLLGKMNSTYEAAPEATAGLTYEGPFGHVID